MGDDLKISILTIGDSQVGKSCLILRFASEAGKFNINSMPTIGIDFKMKTIEIDGQKVKLQIVSISKDISNSFYSNLALNITLLLSVGYSRTRAL